jgi:uncharacterized protein YkwD
MLAVLMLIGLNLNAPWQTIELEVMGRINYARQHGFDCVSRTYSAKAVTPLVPHLKLRRAARSHAADMQARGYFAHESPEGIGVKQRVFDAGYLASRVGENILGGGRLGSSARNAVKWWLESPVHCRNIMNPAYTQFAAGHVFVPSDPAGIQHYWVLDFATSALGQSLGSK